jgi:O-acetyl-ADP-ribose deacetylase
VTELKDIKEKKKELKEKTNGNIEYRGCIITVRRNDISKEPVDAITNPANSRLGNGGGAAEVIEKAAGPAFRKACDDYITKKHSLPVGEAMVTTAGNLP